MKYIWAILLVLVTGAVSAAPAPFDNDHRPCFLGRWQGIWSGSENIVCYFAPNGHYEEYFAHVHYTGRWVNKNGITYVEYRNSIHPSNPPYQYKLKWLTKNKAYCSECTVYLVITKRLR